MTTATTKDSRTSPHARMRVGSRNSRRSTTESPALTPVRAINDRTTQKVGIRETRSTLGYRFQGIGFRVRTGRSTNVRREGIHRFYYTESADRNVYRFSDRRARPVKRGAGF